MKPRALDDRDVELHLARQFGQLYYRELDSAAIRAEFDKQYPSDKDALQAFENGMIYEDQRRLAMRMSRAQYMSHWRNLNVKSTGV